MVDINQQIVYWCQGAQEDWEVGLQLVNSGKSRHGLFFAHLALEKVLKAHVCRFTQEIPPRVHNLVRLSEIAELSLESGQLDILAEMNEFNLEGRYPLTFLTPPTKQETQTYIKRASEVFQWLIQQL